MDRVARNPEQQETYRRCARQMGLNQRVKELERENYELNSRRESQSKIDHSEGYVGFSPIIK